MKHRLEQYFEFKKLGTDWKTEILAGITTFMTMAYIVFVNPAILHETGMPLAAVTGPVVTGTSASRASGSTTRRIALPLRAGSSPASSATRNR